MGIYSQSLTFNPRYLSYISYHHIARSKSYPLDSCFYLLPLRLFINYLRPGGTIWVFDKLL